MYFSRDVVLCFGRLPRSMVWQELGWSRMVLQVRGSFTWIIWEVNTLNWPEEHDPGSGVMPNRVVPFVVPFGPCCTIFSGTELNNISSLWCRERDSNPHEHSPLPPQDSVSTSSTTSANKSDSQYDKKHYIYKILKISWCLIPRPLGQNIWLPFQYPDPCGRLV